MRVYILTMRRWGDPEGHQYVSGVFTDLAECCMEGLEHKLYRGNKYEPYIQETLVDDAFGPILEVSQETALTLAKMKYPTRFDANGHLIQKEDNEKENA